MLRRSAGKPAQRSPTSPGVFSPNGIAAESCRPHPDITSPLNQKKGNRSQGCKVRCASNHLLVSVYRVPQMQGVGRADVLLYFNCPTTKQMRCPVNAYDESSVRNGESC
jgi:hypothetical protein